MYDLQNSEKNIVVLNNYPVRCVGPQKLTIRVYGFLAGLPGAGFYIKRSADG